MFPACFFDLLLFAAHRNVEFLFSSNVSLSIVHLSAAAGAVSEVKREGAIVKEAGDSSTCTRNDNHVGEM